MRGKSRSNSRGNHDCQIFKNKAIEPLGDTLSDWEIVCQLSSAMGYEMTYASPEEIFREIAVLTPNSYAGMTYEWLGIDGLMWPCPNSDNPGSLFLPIHFGENHTNVLTNTEASDPLIKIPEFKVSTVNIVKLSE
jgi:predicted molibdopterin-dependent oxidoreductase YjgC